MQGRASSGFVTGSDGHLEARLEGTEPRQETSEGLPGLSSGEVIAVGTGAQGQGVQRTW